MALECKKTSGVGLVVSNLSKVLPYNGNDQQAPVSTSNNGRDQEIVCGPSKRKTQADVDIREVYFLIMHFLSEGPCRNATAQLKDELEQHGLLPRRYHAWYSRSRTCSGESEDDGISVPLSYSQLLERFSFIERNHLVRLLEELFNRDTMWHSISDARNPTAADASTLLGFGSVSLLNNGCGAQQAKCLWNRAGQVYGLTLREVSGGLARHQRAPAIRAASYQIVKPSVLVNRIQKIKTFRGHRNAVYCAIFDKSGEYIITGSDDRLVKIWSTATGFCLCSCRGHEGDITDLAVSANNVLLASASNDCFIRVWRFPDGCPVSVLKGHSSAVTAIAFSPRQGCEYLLLSASDDGTCRIWDARDSSRNARIYAPKLEGQESGAKALELGQPSVQPRTRILCCAFNASGTVFVTGSADKLARVWDACKWSDEVHGGPYHEFDTLKGHEDDVNYVQFSGCASPSRPVNVDSRPVNAGAPAVKNERISRFRNSWFGYESIVSCSRDGSAIIWVPRPRKYHGKSKWMKGYHLRVPPPPMPLQPPRGVPRQRLLPTPRGVNMIVWSLDNRYVLAAIMDCRICVWNAVDGGLVHSLTGHTKSTFVLDVHPHDPRIAMSAGYDGRVIIWDIWEGRTIHEYNIGDFHLVDGKFSPDGTSIVISDEVGQIYLLATGEGRSQKDAKYDQFFLGDYRPLARDVHGHVLDQETQLSPHERNMRDLLCDANMIPYAEPYQSMYQQRRLGAIGINWHPPPAQWVAGSMDDSSYLAVGFPLLPPPDEDDSEAHQGGTRWVEQPFDEEAMEWEQDSVDDAGSDYTLSFDNACEEDERDCSLSSSEDLLESSDEEDSSEEDELSQRARLRRSERNKKKEEEVATSGGRSTKRKHRDGSRDYSLRRSKRHKKSKRLSRRSSLRRGSDGEQSRRRPRRLAARNARLFFSRIGAEDDEHSVSESSQNVESEGDEQQSTRQSHEKEDGHNLERTEERSTADAEPSEAEWSRPTRSNPSGKLRISTRKASKGQASVQIAGADACSVEDTPEKQVQASVTSRGNASVDSICQHETLCGGPVSSTATSCRGQESEGMHGTSDLELDAASPLRGKRGREKFSSNANKSPRVDSLSEKPSHIVKDELLSHQTGDLCVHATTKKLEVGLQSPDISLQPPSMHIVKNGDGFSFVSENSGLEQRESSLDAYDTQTHKKESLQVSETPLLHENNANVQELIDAVELSNQSCHIKLSDPCIGDVQEQGLRGEEQMYVSSSVHDDGRTEARSFTRLTVNEPLCFQDASSEHDEADIIEGDPLVTNPLDLKDDSKINHLVKDKEEVHQVGDPDYDTDKGAEIVEAVRLNSSNSSLSVQGKPIKVVIGSSRKHQPMGTSWQHNSPTCLWLRQCPNEARDAGPSSSEVESANNENTAEGLERHHESGQAHHLKLTFRRGKRNALKPRKRVDPKPDSQAAVDVHEVKETPDPTAGKLEGGLDEDEFMGKMKVALTYVRTRWHGHADKSGKSVQDKEASKGNDMDSRIERREGLRFSIRSKSNIEDGDQGRTAEDFSCKGKKNKVPWLMLTKVEDGTRYIPQLGDEVAYVLQGQDEFPKLGRLEDKGAPKGLRSQLRAVELCEVVGIEYKNLSGFSGVSCCLTLRLIDEECKAMGKTFRLSLPELTDFPDFLIDRSRYEASLRRNWTKRDRCKVWWRVNTIDENGDEKTGQWFIGRVVAVETKSSQFPWDACMVQYLGDSTGPHRHSPWELFDVDSIEAVPSRMTEATRLQILSTIEDIEASCSSNQDEYGLRALSKLIRKSDFLSKTLVPLSLDTIKDRLRNRYYRSLDAFQYDIQHLASNVQDYLSDDELTFQVQNLADRLLEEG